jgi:hypothetical protein
MINLLPGNLIRNALNLQCIGIRELAWQYDFVFEVLKVLSDNNKIILGGDVYKIDVKVERFLQQETIGILTKHPSEMMRLRAKKRQ